MSDFIDRAKLEAEAEKRWPLWLPTGDYETDCEDYSETDAAWQNAEAEMQRQAFLAGAAAYAALIDAETTEEWGVRHISVDGWPREEDHTSKEAADRDLGTCGWNCHLISRRVAVTPWLPSEGGES